MRSLRPYDKVMTSLPCCKSCRDQEDPDLDEVVQHSETSSVVQEKQGVDNKAMTPDF